MTVFIYTTYIQEGACVVQTINCVAYEIIILVPIHVLSPRESKDEECILYVPITSNFDSRSYFKYLLKINILNSGTVHNRHAQGKLRYCEEIAI